MFLKCCTFRVAAEQKARATYEKLIDLAKDHPDVVEPLKFLRQREVVHFQRFGEALRGVQDRLATRKFYMDSDSPMFVNNNDNMTMNNTQNMNNMNTNMNMNMGMNYGNNGCGCGR